MRKRLTQTIILLIIAFVLPFFPATEVFTYWQFYLTLSLALVLNMSQPDYQTTSIAKRTHDDKMSMFFLTLAGFLIFMLPIADLAYFGNTVREDFHYLSGVGLFLAIGGLIFRMWAIKVLGRFFTPKVEIQSDHEIIQSGPYRWIRHPSYTGSLVMALGIAIYFESILSILFVFFGFFGSYIYRIKCEEHTLAENFGEAYRSYRKKTWAILPPIY